MGKVLKRWGRSSAQNNPHRMTMVITLNSNSCLSKKIGYFYFNESSLEIMNNAFCFILKTLFILKVACKFRFGKRHF